MFIILIAPKSGQPMSLFYNTQASCEIAHKNIYEFQKGSIEAPVMIQKDDFGHVVSIARDNISHAIVIDHEKAKHLGPPPQQRPISTIRGNGAAMPPQDTMGPIEIVP